MRLKLHVQHEAWAKPAHREAVVKYFKTRRTHEELTRLHVEIQRLHVSIRNETMQMQEVLNNLSMENPTLCAELRHRWKLRLSINDIHLQRLAGIKIEPYFNEHNVNPTRASDGGVTSSNEFDDTADFDDAIEAENAFHVITDFVSNIME